LGFLNGFSKISKFSWDLLCFSSLFFPEYLQTGKEKREQTPSPKKNGGIYHDIS
jgi:hypothetical protein